MTRITTVIGMLGLIAACSRAPALTHDQRAAIAKLYDSDGQELVGLEQQLISKQYELDAAAAAEPPDANQVQTLTHDVTALHAQVLQAQTAMQGRLAAAGCPTCRVPGAGMMGRMMGGRGMGGMMRGRPYDGRCRQP